MMRRPKTANFEDSWRRISSVTTAVMSEEPVEPGEWCEQITSVYYLCMAMPTPLAEDLYTELKKYLVEHVIRCKDKVLDVDNDILATYNTLYKTFSRGAGYLNDLYMHLNQHFTKRTMKNEWCDHYMHSIEKVKKFEKVQDLAMNIWKEQMIEKVHVKLIDGILHDITRDRRGISTHSTILRDIIHSFVEVQAHEDPQGAQLQLYKDLFEKRLLEHTGQFYHKEAQKLYETNSVSNYMLKVIEKLEDEELRLRKFIHHTSIGPCKKECVNKLIADREESLLEEYKVMLKENQVEDLSRLYILIRRLNQGCKKMADIFHDHVFLNGKDSIDLMNKGCSPEEYVTALLLVYKHFNNIVLNNLHDDRNFVNALDRAMTKMVNSTSDTKRYPKSSELLVRHSDHILKKSKTSSLENETQLQNFIDLFKYVEDKDLFQKFYSKKLANRLIQNTTISIDTEEFVINGLRERCGYEYTAPLHRMLVDMKVSDDLTKEFETYLRGKKEVSSIAFSVNILQTGAWPFTASTGASEEQGDTPLTEFNIPQDLASFIDKFTTFYNKKYSGRKLKFVFPLSSGTVTLHYTARQHTITMSTFQLATLLLFNERDTISVTEICANSGLDKSDVSKTLTTLVESSLLKKTDPDNYSINLGYQHKKVKIRLPATVAKEHSDQKEVEQTHQSVEEDRRLYIQAAIVRTMKSRKQFGHNELIQQVINLAKERFTPSVAMIKKCVEVLIEKQYLERLENQRDMYQYLA